MPEPDTTPPPSSLLRLLRLLIFVAVCVATLLALTYAEENWRGKEAWQKYRGQWEAKGESFDFSALLPPPVPEAENFAQTPLLKPLYEFTTSPVVWRDTNTLTRLHEISANLSNAHNRRPDEFKLGNLEQGTFTDLAALAAFYRENTNYPQAAASATPAETILTALGKFDAQLGELREAAASRPLSRFDIHYDKEPVSTILLPHLSVIKGLIILTSARATAELEAHRSADAVADLKLGFRLADSITNEFFLIDHLVRIAGLSINLQTVREGLHRNAWTDAQLAELESYLAGLDVLAEYQLAMRGERACGLSGLDFMRRQGFKADPFAYLDLESDRSSSTPQLPLNLMPGGWYYQNMLVFARLHERYALPVVDTSAQRVFPEVSESGSSAIQAIEPRPWNIMAKMIFGGLGRASLRFARTQVELDCARLACALERYRLANGKLPESLDALTPRYLAALPHDIMDGKPLRYRVETGGGYILYSVGWNQTDDGGEIAWLGAPSKSKEARVDLTRGDWVWKMTE